MGTWISLTARWTHLLQEASQDLTCSSAPHPPTAGKRHPDRALPWMLPDGQSSLWAPQVPALLPLRKSLPLLALSFHHGQPGAMRSATSLPLRGHCTHSLTSFPGSPVRTVLHSGHSTAGTPCPRAAPLLFPSSPIPHLPSSQSATPSAPQLSWRSWTSLVRL